MTDDEDHPSKDLSPDPYRPELDRGTGDRPYYPTGLSLRDWVILGAACSGLVLDIVFVMSGGRAW